MQDNLKTRLLHDLIENIQLGDIRDNDHLELAAAGLVGVGFADLLRLVLGPDGGDHGVALGEELLENVGWSVIEIVSIHPLLFYVPTSVCLSMVCVSLLPSFRARPTM